MKRIVIIGGGFAGLAAARRLRSRPKHTEVSLLDKRPHSELLPMLPDIIGRRMPESALRTPIADLIAQWGIRFVEGSAIGIDLESRRVATEDISLEYDGLIIAAGSETYFHGHDEFAKNAFTLDSVAQALRLAEAVDAGGFDAVVVVGGGYTGVEIATHIRRRQRKLGRETSIMIAQLGPSLLAKLGARISHYCTRNCERMDIQLRMNTTVARVDEDGVILNNGRRIERPLLIWTAGVRTPNMVRELSLPQTPQGRFESNEFLEVGDGIFAAGDCAAFSSRGQLLRMGVQFSISEGWHAADNLLRWLEGRPLEPFKPWDPGYIVPMGNGRGCGVPLGVYMQGRSAVALHYAMCLLRSHGMARRIGILRNLCFGSK